MVLQVRVPTPSSTALLNLLGVLGVLAVIVAVGALTDWRWGLMTFGAFALGLVVLAQSSVTPAAAAAPVADLADARARKAV